MNIVIYARFSSHKQNEQSIEGQLKTCYEYIQRMGYRPIGEYIDRAISGTSADSRTEFLRMIDDSAKKQFDAVLVYQLDRFARNRYDSAIYKAKLKKNCVRVLSARENISDDASGVLMEAVLEGMAEYYSRELSQKVKRGMQLVAEKCQSTGTRTPLGYTIGEDKRFYVDEPAAAVVREIYKMYADGQTIAQIIAYLNAQQVKTSKGGSFNKNSLRTLLSNKKYIGVYTYADIEIECGVPRILSDELFYQVQEIMEVNKKAPARSRAKEEYILTTKLFCGHCKRGMVGVSGTSKTGAIHNYYACVNAKQKLCKKKSVVKKWLEDLVINKCRDILTDENIEIIAAAVVAACEKDKDDTNIKRLQKILRDNEKAVENLFKALEAGQVADQITKRIHEKNIERDEIEKQIFEEQKGKITLSIPKVKFFLTKLKKADINDSKNRKALVTVLVNAIYLYDDKITFVLNAADKPTEITISLLNDIEQAAISSFMNNTGSPNLHTSCTRKEKIRKKKEKYW